MREQLDRFNVLPTQSLSGVTDRSFVRVAGLILVRQRPQTASGICFITIEDETGTANLVVFKKLFDEYRKEIIQAKLLMVEGQVQKEGEVIHVVVKRCHNFSKLLKDLTETKQDDTALTPKSRADETTSPFMTRSSKEHTVIQGKIFPEGRNFK